ncbi:MAG: putative baseplate assembly protein [Caldimonas sp.]
MPLEALLPAIDDRQYDDIVAELRTRIARYTPEWTPDADALWSDLNDSDPGITLAQLFAWLTEMLLFRLGRVPELNYIKFLELIGVELNAAAPARAEVTFAVDDTWTDAVVLVPPRVQIAAAGDDGPPVVFETERALTALACRLLSVQAYDGAAYRDATTANGNAQSGFLPFGEVPRDDAAFVLGFGFPATHPNFNQFPAVSLDLAVWVADPTRQPTVVQCTALTTPAFASAKIVWEAFVGTGWQAIDALNDETLALTRSGHLVVRITNKVALARTYLGAYQNLDASGAAQPELFWLRARLTRTAYERPPHLLAVRTNTVPVVQAQTVVGEILGGSNGGRNQRFVLENAPVLKGSVQVQIDDGTGPRTWAFVGDLLGAGPKDEVLVLNAATGEIGAGDGQNGAIPVANVADPDSNVVALEYRFGGGKLGNVGANAIVDLLTPVDGIDGGKTTNLFAAYGGRDEESLDAAQKRARRQLRARDRAVTIDDFEQLATEAGNVKRAKALPLSHPDFPGTQIPGVVSVIVVPDSDAEMPMPSDGLLRTVCAYLDARRLLTTEIFVLAPRYVDVEIDAQVVVTDDADTAQVKDAVTQALTDYLHPLRGGDDGMGWPFGGTIRYSKLVQRAFVDGVDSIENLTITLEGEAAPLCTDVAISGIASNALPHLAAVRLEVLTLRELEQTA